MGGLFAASDKTKVMNMFRTRMLKLNRHISDCYAGSK